MDGIVPRPKNADMLALCHALVGLLLLGHLIFGVTVWAGEAFNIEVFAVSTLPVRGLDHERLRAATVTIHAIDGLDRFETTISEGLPSDQESAKPEVLRRIRLLDDARMSPARNAAIGLAKAIQYGVDRYPAMVFDGRAVIYGVTDLVHAVDRYDVWERDQAR